MVLLGLVILVVGVIPLTISRQVNKITDEISTRRRNKGNRGYT